MDKTTYWISVGTQEILPKEEGIMEPTHEFEIEADPDEIEQLQMLFNRIDHTDHRLVGRAKTPYEAFSEHNKDEKNNSYDEDLKDIYRFIYRLGSPETKAHILKMHVI